MLMHAHRCAFNVRQQGPLWSHAISQFTCTWGLSVINAP